MKEASFVVMFVRSAGILLAVTALAKLTSSFGTDRILDYPDPVFLLKNRHVFVILGVMELIVSFYCFLSNNQKTQASIIAIVSSNILLYRLGVYWLGYKGLCPCLGSMSSVLHVSPRVFDTALQIIMAYLLIGGYALLIYLWRVGKKTDSHP